MTVHILIGDCRDVLRAMPDKSVHCFVTSPPYWGLRDYGTATWLGGDPACDHKTARPGAGRADGIVDDRAQRSRDGVGSLGGDCKKCGAVRVDSQIGLEAEFQQFVAEMVGLFRELRRVLRDDGTLWLNLGDSYNSLGGIHAGRDDNQKNVGAAARTWRQGSARADGVVRSDGMSRRNRDGTHAPGLKAKDLIGIPWRVAFALQADGWYLRQDIIWHKPNPMPESVRDRCTKAHEYIFLLTKAEEYFFDADAIKEPVSGTSNPRKAQGAAHGTVSPKSADAGRGVKANARFHAAVGDLVSSRNKRSVWTVPSRPFSEAHFATFPPDLIEPCILAGTSAHGCCPQCSAPWRRVVERKGMVIDRSSRTHALGRSRSSGTMVEPAAQVLVGWYPTCACIGAPALPGYPPKPSREEGGADAMDAWEAACDAVRAQRAVLVAGVAGSPVVPAVVGDPFGGAGTTALVASAHGRDSVLIELNPDYAAMARARIDAAGMSKEGGARHMAKTLGRTAADHGPLFGDGL